MPTATSTLTKQPSPTAQPDTFLFKLSSPPPPQPDSSVPQTSTSATLRSLYTRAARSFVLRDVETTCCLLQSAFSILKPPSSTAMDSLSDDRKKWDILRITFESTVYSSPPLCSIATLPESLRTILTEAPQALVTAIYSRSLSLFTPSGTKGKSPLNAACLPPQVRNTLLYSSLKLGVPDVGKMIIDDWLSRREPLDAHDGVQNKDGYDKVLELYILHILPKLGQWDYAKEFLQYESELPAARRDDLKNALSKLLHQSMPPPPPPPEPSPSPPSPSGSQSISPRSYSPALSTSSSSSVSTTSTRTVVPTTATPRGRSFVGLSALTSSKLSAPPAASSSSVLNGDAILESSTANGHLEHREPTPPAPFSKTSSNKRPRSKSRTHSSTSSGLSNLPRSRVEYSTARPSPSALSLIKASLAPYLTKSRMTTFLLMFIFIPLVAFILRMRRRRRQARLGPLAVGAATAGMVSATVSNADLVRRRLHGPSTAESGMLGKAWNDIVRVVGDTVRMAGSGLV